jgi:hypothetical protein
VPGQVEGQAEGGVTRPRHPPRAAEAVTSPAGHDKNVRGWLSTRLKQPWPPCERIVEWWKYAVQV